MFLCVLLAAWISHAHSFNVSISHSFGVDNSSCFHPNGAHPCKSINYALGILNDVSFDGETTFIFFIQDKDYDLRNQVQISQPRPDRQIFITTAGNFTSVIRCGIELSGIDICGIVIGYQTGDTISTFNIHVSNMEFQQFNAKSAAVVLMWNAVNVSFTNCIFTDNKRSGLNAYDSGVTIDGCLFSNNTSNVQHTHYRDLTTMSVAGGAGLVFLNVNGLTAVVRNTNFAGNSAAMNDSENFIPPHSISKVPKLNYLGGGLLVAFLKIASSNRALVQNSVFANNKATFGGGLFHSFAHDTEGNLIKIQGSSFINNRASQSGGGLGITLWDSSEGNILVEDCVISDNWSRRGGGLNVFLMNYQNIFPMEVSTIKFKNVTLDGNSGRASAAVRLDTALPVGYHITVKPEFINCTIKNHGATYLTYTAPFTSQRIHVKFSGRNVFTMNHGAGAIEYQEGVIHVNGRLEFNKNTGSHGGALLFRASQIMLHPGSELNFVENVATGVGGAIMVQTRAMYEFIHEYNPDCFVAYSEERTKPSEWKAKVSFIKNRAKVKGAAIYISSLSACLWYEDYPFYSAEKALRWNNTFEYRSNFIHPGKIFKPLTGPAYDIATDTHHFEDEDHDDKSIELSPGEGIMLDIQGYDQLNHTIFTIATLSETSEPDDVNKRLSLDNTMRLLSPVNKLSAFPFSYRLANETFYEELTNRTVHRFQLEDIFSVLKNRYRFNVTAIPCRPGYKFKGTVCSCDKTIEGVLRCSDDSRTVFLKDGYWGGVVDGRLVTYFCPSHYCKCVRDGDLPGCEFNADHVDNQCAHNRTGVLCGQCKPGLSVGLRLQECLDCEGAGAAWIIAVVVIFVVIVCVIIIILNPSMSSELRGPLFFFQMLPFIFEPNNVIGESVLFVADLLNFGGPFVFFLHSCIVEGMNNLFAVAMGYLMPFVTLLVFLISYVLSANFYLVKFKFRKNSSLQSFWLMTLFVYNYLTVTTFMLLHCPEVGGKLVFYYDGNVQCFKGEHLGMALLAFFVLLVLVIPLPIIVLVLTKGYWKVDPQYVNTLTNGLSPHCSWWWSVDLLRRVLLMATYAFIPHWATKQIIMILMCALVLAAHSIFQPYRKKRVNVVETLYLYILCTMAIMQVLKENNIANIVCFALLIATTVHFLALTIYKAAVFVKKRLTRPKRYPTRRGYGSMAETQIESSIDPEQIRRKNIFDIIFSRSDDSGDNFGK